MPEHFFFWRKVGLVAEVTAGFSRSALTQLEENCIASKVRVGRIQILTFVDVQCGKVLFQIPLQKVNSRGRWALTKLYQEVSEIRV